MSRAVIQVQKDRVAFDGRTWTPVSGESADILARILNTLTPEFRRAPRYYPDWTQGIALEAAAKFKGELIEYEPNPLADLAPPDRIY